MTMDLTRKELEQASLRPLAKNGLTRRLGAIGAWIDQRTGFGRPLYNFFTYPVPLYVHRNLLYSLGGLSLISLVLQITTGILLSFYYDPSTEGAYNSVDYVTYHMPLGWMIRGLHYYNASALVILIVLHLLRTFFFSAYKSPREITWLSGLFMLLTVLAFAFSGALLPWDQGGYWATKVGSEIAGSTPVLGLWIKRLLQGGAILGQATLTRFYVIHVLLLPPVIVSLLLLHIHQLRFHGVAPAITPKGQALARKFVPFFPHWMTVDASLGVGMLFLLIGLAWFRRAPLEFPADPTSTDFIPRPEWYFLPLYQMLKYFPGPLEPLAALVLPGLLIGGLALLPFLDRGEERRPWRKPLITSLALICILLVAVLTVLAMRSP